MSRLLHSSISLNHLIEYNLVVRIIGEQMIGKKLDTLDLRRYVSSKCFLYCTYHGQWFNKLLSQYLPLNFLTTQYDSNYNIILIIYIPGTPIQCSFVDTFFHAFVERPACGSVSRSISHGNQKRAHFLLKGRHLQLLCYLTGLCVEVVAVCGEVNKCSENFSIQKKHLPTAYGFYYLRIN